jgi:hypothetical protein
MTAIELLATLKNQGFTLRPVKGGKLRIEPGSKLTPGLTEQLRQCKAELLALLTQPATQPGNRDFLSRPLGQENNPDAWDAWTPFMLWLLEFHPEHYYAVCDAEDAISALERQGVTSGPRYEAACHELLRRFETARRLALSERVKVWTQ